MTTQERAKLQAFVNKVNEYSEIAEYYSHELQLLNHSSGDHVMWCSPQANLDGILKGPQAFRGKQLYDGYIRAMAKADCVAELGQVLAELNFWKD